MIGAYDYQTLREILLRTSGHALGEGKEYLVERRLSPVAECLDHPDVASLIQHLRITQDRRTTRLVCEAMTTNETLFFRDGRPFDLLRERLIPDLLARRRAERRLRIWSAACSTGQEAYSVAMTLAEMGDALAGWTVDILATDYVPEVLDRARAGVFNHFEVQRGLPVQMLLKYFDASEAGWRVKDSLKRGIRFEQGNLLEGFGHLGPFDIVFCRNVLIYFDVEGKRDVLHRLSRVVAPDGYLFLGASETSLGVTDTWRVLPDCNTTLFQIHPTSPAAPRSLVTA